ncbi:putative lactoylglutathione lyase [Rhodococcus sp. 27YEA15]|uniref:VOC family protein n=1 Tax=Rhodococcus sp. 27YEA15 TaxID=3156259 RepID=UPI003C797FA5
MSTMFFLNLPVKDLSTATAFYEGLGYSKNPQFSDENATSIVISDTIVVMLLVEPFFKTFTTKEISDTATSTEALLGLSAESREAVDTIVDKALATGGSEGNALQDHGFMYSRSFQDPDGHIWEIIWMDESQIAG